MKSLKSLYNSIRSDSPFRNSGESARNSPRNSTRNQNVDTGHSFHVNLFLTKNFDFRANQISIFCNIAVVTIGGHQ